MLATTYYEQISMINSAFCYVLIQTETQYNYHRIENAYQRSGFGWRWYYIIEGVCDTFPTSS